MQIEQKLVDISIKLQKLQTNSHLLKIVYFSLKLLLAGPVLIGIYSSNYEIFDKLELQNQLKEKLPSFIIQRKVVFELAFSLSIITLLVTFYLLKKLRYDGLLRIIFSLFLVIGASSYFTLWIWMLIVQHDQCQISIKTLSTILVILIQVAWIIIQKNCISFSFNSQNSFLHKPNKIVFMINCLQKILFVVKCYFIKIIPHSHPLSTCIDSGIIIINATRLGKLYIILQVFYIREKFYIDQISNRLEISCCLFSLIYFSLVQISNFLDEAIINQNQLIISLTIWLFSAFSVEFYQSNQQNYYYYADVEEVIQKKLFTPYLQANHKLWANFNTHESSIIIASLKKNHIYSCKSQSCYCQTLIYNENQEDNIHFLQGYFSQILESIWNHKFNSDKKLKILNFKFQIFKNVLDIGKQIHDIRNTVDQSFVVKFALKSLSQRIQSLMKQKNFRDQDLNFQLPLTLDQTLISLQKIILSEVQVKNNKWQYLCRTICKTLEIQTDIVKEISNISQFQRIFHDKRHIYKKSLSFNAICLFYYAQIVFLKKQVSKLQQTLKEIKLVSNFNFIISYKQLSKNLFDPRCCFIEISLSQSQIDENFEFSIFDCNRNVKSVFHYKKQETIKKKLQDLYPNFIWLQIKTLLFNYLKNDQKQFNSLSFETYFIDKSKNVFKALSCFRVIPKIQGVYLSLVMFKKQTDKVILLNQNYEIQNVGQTFKKYFGNFCEGLPFESLFYKQQEYQEFKITQKITHWSNCLIYGAQIGKQWRLYLQKVKFYIERSLKNSFKAGKSSMTLKAMTTKKHIRNNISDFMAEQKQKLMQTKISSQTSQEKSERIIKDNKSKSVLVVSFNCKKCRINNLVFNEIILEGVKRKRPNRDRKKTLYIFDRDADNLSDRNRSVIQQDQQEGQYYNSEAVQLQQEQVQSIQLDKEKMHNAHDQTNFIHQNSSVQSSIRGQSMTYFYSNFVQICFNLFKNPQEIYDKRLNYFTGISLFLSILISILIVSTHVLFDLGLYEIKDIFFADGAVSDNMQLTQLMYNRAMNFKQYKNDPIEFQSIIKSALFERQYVMGLVVYDMIQFLNARTKMTNSKFYQYLKVPATWKSRQTQTQIQIQSNQFLVFYYYLSRQVELNILDDTPESKQVVNDAFYKMKDNFPEMQRINHYNLDLYKNMSDQSLDLVDNFTYVLMVAHVLISLLIFGVFYRQKVFRRQQQIQGYSIYKLIPHKIIEILFNYYHNHKFCIKKQSDLLKYQTHFQRSGIYLPTDGSVFLKSNNSTFITNNFKSPFAIWRMVFVLLFINVLYCSVLIQVRQLAVPIEKMMNNVNDLMDSQNYLFETYFDFKAQFIIDQNNSIDLNFFDKLLQSQQSNEVIFNKIAVESLNLFANYDQTYTKDFINLLINNTCDLVKGQISQQQYLKCKSYFKINMLQNGVIMGMNFFTRKIKNTILMFKEKLLNGLKGNQTQQANQILKSLDFRQIDESLIFMFKMYQATQARIYLSLQKTIINLTDFSLSIIFIELLIIGIFYPVVLYWNYRNEKYQLSKLYVSFLLIPSPVSKMIKPFAGKIQQVLQYDKNA